MTARQFEVFVATIRETSYARAAAALGISIQTVKNHMASALRRTGAQSSAHLAWLLGRPLLRALDPHYDRRHGRRRG